MEIILPEDAKFEWDKHNIAHIGKHTVTQEEAEEVFYQEPQVIAYDEIHSTAEARYAFLGRTKEGRKLMLIFTLRGKNKERIRILSARDQSKKERKEYEAEIHKIKKEGDETI